MEYPINKGIGRSVEFKGLKAQYLFIFCGGLLAVFGLFVGMYMAGVPPSLFIGFGVFSASVLLWVPFHPDGKYGGHGLVKPGASPGPPRYILNRKAVSRLFTHQKRKEAIR